MLAEDDGIEVLEAVGDALDVAVREAELDNDDDPEEDGVLVAVLLLDPLPDADPEALALPVMADGVALPLALLVEVGDALEDADGDAVDVGAPVAVDEGLLDELAEAVDDEDVELL